MKKQISTLLLLLCVQLLALAAAPDSLVLGRALLSGNEIPMWYNVNQEGEAKVGNGFIAAISQYATGHLEVPGTFRSLVDDREYKVVGIGDFAFSLCNNLSRVTLPEGVQSIGEHAFTGCEKLMSVDFPTSLTAIGRGAFCECRNLRHVVLPEGLRELGQESFVKVSFQEKKLIVPRQITAIPLGAFEKSDIEVVVLPPSLQSIAAEAFAGVSDCDYYMFDGEVAPQVDDKATDGFGHWFMTRPELYREDRLSDRHLIVLPMTHEGSFDDGGFTYTVKGYGRYPGKFEAVATRRSASSVWEEAFKELPTSAAHPDFSGYWRPKFDVTGIAPSFFSGEGIERLQHVVLPATIVPQQAAKAFAQVPNLLSLDLGAMAPLTLEDSKTLLEGLADNAVVYAPNTQTEFTRDHNLVLMREDGTRHTSLFQLNLASHFEEQAQRGKLAYALPHAFQAERASFYRASFAAQQVETLVLPFTADAQGKAYAFQQLRPSNHGATAVFGEETELAAHKGYLYVSNGQPITATQVEIATAEQAIDLTADAGWLGVLRAGVIRQLPGMEAFAGQVYVSRHDDAATAQLSLAKAEDAIAPFQAFFYTKIPLAGGNVKLQLGSVPTAVEDVVTAQARSLAPVYNLQGVRIAAPVVKGVYIRQGKKYMAQ